MLVGSDVAPDVLIDFPSHDPAVVVARISIAAVNCFKLPLLVLPLRRTLRSLVYEEESPESWQRLPATFVLVALLVTAALLLQDLGKSLELLGCTAGTCVCLVFPARFYLVFLRSPGVVRKDRVAALLMLALGAVIGTLSFGFTFVFWKST